MDEKKLRYKLIRLYIITIAVILTVMFAAAVLLNVKDQRQKGRESFYVLFASVAERLQSDSAIQHSLLRKNERENEISYFITDSGNTLEYNSDDGEAHTALREKVRELAAAEGMDVDAVPLTAQRATSSVFEFQYGGTDYYGAASVIPINNSYRTLIAAQKIQYDALWRYAYYVAAYLLSAFALAFVGVKLIDRALRPAVESRTRQTEFIAAASHELRSPLAVIQANAATVAAMPERAVSAADTISAECSRMSRLIADMLLLASTDAGAWSVTLAETEVDTLLIDVYEAYLPVCARRGFSLELKLPESVLPAIQADAERLKQVLGILLDNAMNYGAAASDKSICLSAETVRGRLVVSVADHGIGVSDEQKPHIFDRFYRGDKARGAKQHFGLGLAIARELVLLHGGVIAVCDTAGGGSTFTITL